MFFFPGGAKEGVGADNHLLKKSYGGLIRRSEGVTWKNLDLGDDRVNLRRERVGGLTPPLSVFRPLKHHVSCWN